MKTLGGSVRNGRLVVDEPSRLPEGTVVELVMADGGDELDEEELAVLHGALSAAWARARAGDVRPAEELLDTLQTRP